MSDNIFPDDLALDTEFLNSTYSDDPETAIVMFENYLQELPSNMKELRDSYDKQDIERFRQLVHKQKPAFSYVGLTDVTDQFQQLQMNCLQTSDLDTYKDDIQKAFARIESSMPLIEETLGRLRRSTPD